MQGGGIARHGRCHTCEALASIGGRCATPPRARGGTPPEGRAAPGRTTDGPTVAPAGAAGRASATGRGRSPSRRPTGRPRSPDGTHDRDTGAGRQRNPRKAAPADQRPKRAGKRAREGPPAPGRRGSPHATPSGAPTAPPRAQQRGAEPFQTAAGGGRPNRHGRQAGDPHGSRTDGKHEGDPDSAAEARTEGGATPRPENDRSRAKGRPATRGKPPGANRAEGAPNGTRPEYRVGPELATGGDGERPRNAPRADGGKGPRPKVQARTTRRQDSGRDLDKGAAPDRGPPRAHARGEGRQPGPGGFPPLLDTGTIFRQ